jgi:hypothetical protein
MKHAVVRGRKVAVAPGITSVKFSCGENGIEEAGLYCFWCAFGTDEFGEWRISGRALDSLPPEDRFLRAEVERLVSNKPGDKHNALPDRAAYEALWRRLLTIEGIRPASYREVANWMSSHKEDSLYAEPNWVCQGKKMFGLPPKEII